MPQLQDSIHIFGEETGKHKDSESGLLMPWQLAMERDK